MIIELNTKLLDLPEQINMNQLVFLSMILDKNQKTNQDVRKLVSLISDDDISYLIQKDLIVSIERDDFTIYEQTEKLKSFLKPKENYFDLFYKMYPSYVVRPEGSKSYLRANLNKCKHLYETFVGNSSSLAEHINNCLKFELDKKSREGKMSYMKTMYRWLQSRQWEESEEEMNDNTNINRNIYGTELI